MLRLAHVRREGSPPRRIERRARRFRTHVSGPRTPRRRGPTMTQTTTRFTPPTEFPRSVRNRAALPNDPGLDALLADPALGSTAQTIAIALVKHWAWYKDHCWPSDETIAKKIGKSPGHVQRCLRQLELAGWIRREHTSAVPCGRRIWLLWRRPDAGQGARPAPAPVRTGEPAPARSERVVVEQGGTEPE